MVWAGTREEDEVQAAIDAMQKDRSLLRIEHSGGVRDPNPKKYLKIMCPIP